MKKTLVILAAGIGSRFGGGIKQLEPVGPGNEIIMDYSIHDAIKAGFNKIVFIIRKDIESDFREIIGNKIEAVASPAGVEIAYAFQSMDNIPAELREGRKKPFGTAHAILCCKDIIDGPFAVINADDYYGKDSFIKASAQLETGNYGLIGFILKNTLSENGGVSRGVCTVENGLLQSVVETHNIIGTPDGAESEGKFIDGNSLVSMNFWCLPEKFMDVLSAEFPKFLNGIQNPLKDEFMLPTVIGELLQKGEKVDVISTASKWFGVTYKEDKPSVVESFRKLYSSGEYAENLYSDI